MSRLIDVPASFRDPGGFLYERDGILYRQINQSYRVHYEQLVQSGLYDALVKSGLLVEHTECDISLAKSDLAYKVIQPKRLHYISYPYEWCFSQIKDAALLTLRIQKLALEYGMILKDASAYNVQFFQGRPIFIDTLSFEKYESGPWKAYRQFCQHFFAPLCMLTYTDHRLSKLYRVYIDGPPLDLVSKLLPFQTWFKYSILAHIHIHARAQKHYSKSADEHYRGNKDCLVVKVSKNQITAIASQLESAIKKLNFGAIDTEWSDYYSDTNYTNTSLDHKKKLVKEYIANVSPSPVLIQDIGANDGSFSRIAAESGACVISQDIDEVAVEKNYIRCLKSNDKQILPLVLDLTNPSPDLGWANEERDSALKRSKCNVLMALALIHHIAISNNVPLEKISYLFSRLCDYLIIEFVPKQDSQVIRLLATREDIFPEYNFEGFEHAFAQFFITERCDAIPGTERKLYLMKIRPDLDASP